MLLFLYTVPSSCCTHVSSLCTHLFFSNSQKDQQIFFSTATNRLSNGYRRLFHRGYSWPLASIASIPPYIMRWCWIITEPTSRIPYLLIFLFCSYSLHLSISFLHFIFISSSDLLFFPFLTSFSPLSLSPSLYVYHNLFGFTLPENRLRSGRPGIRIPVGETFFSSPKRTDRLWGPPTVVFNGYQGSFPDVKRPECDVDHSPPSSVDVKKSCAIRLLPLYTFMTWKGANLPLNFLLWFHKCLTLIYYQELEDMPYN